MAWYQSVILPIAPPRSEIRPPRAESALRSRTRGVGGDDGIRLRLYRLDHFLPAFSRILRALATNRFVTGKRVGAFCLLSVLAIGACETIVEIDYPEKEPRIAVNSIFRPGWKLEISLSEARGLVRDDNTFKSITTADAELFRNGELIERLPHVGGGIYRSPSTEPAPGDVMELRVSAPGFEPAVATDVVPTPVPVEFEFDPEQKTASHILALTIHLTDPPDAVNYYRLTAISKFNQLDGGAWTLPGFYTDDDAIVAENVDPFDDVNDNFVETAFLSDKLLDSGGHDFRIEVRAPSFLKGSFSSLEVNVDVISKSFYDYATSYRKYESYRDNPFKEPVPVSNNVENGYGLFAGFYNERLFVEF